MSNSFFEIHSEVSGFLPFFLFSIGESVPQPPIQRPFGYEAHQFLWIDEGEGDFVIDGESFSLRAGEGVFFRADVPNSYQGRRMNTKWLSFMLNSETLDFLGVGRMLRFRVPATLEREYTALLRFAQGNSTPISRSSMGYKFTLDLFSSILTPQISTSSKVLHFLECSFAMPLTLGEIAEHVGMDKYALCRQFLRETGSTVMNELLRIRIEKAKQLLRFRNDSIGCIGELCGFESAAYFGKRFRETVGCTPLEYRKQYRKSAFIL